MSTEAEINFCETKNEHWDREWTLRWTLITKEDED